MDSSFTCYSPLSRPSGHFAVSAVLGPSCSHLVHTPRGSEPRVSARTPAHGGSTRSTVIVRAPASRTKRTRQSPMEPVLGRTHAAEAGDVALTPRCEQLGRLPHAEPNRRIESLKIALGRPRKQKTVGALSARPGPPRRSARRLVGPRREPARRPRAPRPSRARRRTVPRRAQGHWVIAPVLDGPEDSSGLGLGQFIDELVKALACGHTRIARRKIRDQPGRLRFDMSRLLSKRSEWPRRLSNGRPRPTQAVRRLNPLM